MSRKKSFPPVTDQHTQILILGSLPGEESLRQAQYYAHPQNRFWELVGQAIGQDLRSLGYDERLNALVGHGIGLWDVIGSAKRSGSLDSAIKEEAGNDLASLVGSLPALQVIAFNGKKAGQSGRRLLSSVAGELRLIDLPSSSPAYAAMPYEEKQSQWAVIGDIAANPESMRK